MKDVLLIESEAGLCQETRPEKNPQKKSRGFCAYTLVADSLEDAAVLIVTDARRDLRFMRNPLVLGEPYIQPLGVKILTKNR